ncbi:MAG: type II toxin-antitoxin system VapC family toxin [Fimbriimonadaceae bacterium]|nr:type II toxin-antitoxin system VapC family toxin [Fimbriimonadaceae bacterium]
MADDPAYGRATGWYRELTERGWLPVTSHLVVSEALTRLRYDISLAAALRLLGLIELQAQHDLLELVPLTPTLWQAALGWFRRYADQRFSVVDCTSFAIMAAAGMTDALTADRHFATAGFRPLGVATPEAG